MSGSSSSVAQALGALVQPLRLDALEDDADGSGALVSSLVPSSAEVVLLGESTHGTQQFYFVRKQISQHLVRERGFRAVLIEAEWPDIFMVNEYITQAKSGFATAKAALAQLQGHGKHMWQNHATVELVEWLKHFNHSQDYRPDAMVYIFGIDCQQIYRSLNMIYMALTDANFNLYSELKARLSFFNGHSEKEHEYAKKTVRGIGSEQIPEILQKILSEWQWEHFKNLKSKLSPLELINIEQNLEVIVNAEEYFRKMELEPAGSQVSWNTRDQHMALTVSRLRERLLLLQGKPETAPNGDVELPKVVVWAHNSHIGSAAASKRGGLDFSRNQMWNLGQMISNLTHNSYLLGFDTYEGQVTALARDQETATKTYDLNPAIKDSSEYWCHLACQEKICEAFHLPLAPLKQATRTSVCRQPLPGDFIVVLDNLPVYSSTTADSSSGTVLKKGHRFQAVERIWSSRDGHDCSRLRIEDLGWVDELVAPGELAVLSASTAGLAHDVLFDYIPQRYVGVNYCPETELQSHYSEATLVGQYDALVFIDRTSALKVLTAQELVLSAESAAKMAEAKSKPGFSRQGIRRLLQEYRHIRRHPIPQIRVGFRDDSVYQCHFLLTPDSGDYAGGEYHGRLEFPKEYPMAPPSVFLMTPNGRFETNKRICVSFSDYHPELWNPSWGVESVLVGLQSFMQEESPGALGSMRASSGTRQRLAKESHAFNMKNSDYVELFASKEAKEAAEDKHEEAHEEEDQPYCRYCRVSGGDLVSPCECKGGNQYVHLECLAKWQYQAILSQSTHPRYQTGLEKRCNVCQTEFKIKQYSREGLVLTFTGTEMANMIQRGCLLVATRSSTKHNLRLMEQYADIDPSIIESLSHWTKCVFLIAETFKSFDGQKEGVLGFSLTNSVEPRQIPHRSARDVALLQKLGLGDCKQFIGGPVEPFSAFVVLAVRTSSLKNSDIDTPTLVRIAMFHDHDLSLWFVKSADEIHLPEILQDIGSALVEARVFWGYAAWDRVQLLGEIARGAWGLATAVPSAWLKPAGECWEEQVERAVVAGKNDFSLKYGDEE